MYQLITRQSPVLFAFVRAISYETPQLTLARLQASSKTKELIKYDAQTGNVFLHEAAQGRINHEEMESIIDILGKKDAAALAKIKNNEGILPLTKAPRLPLSDNDRQIKSTLETLTRTHHQKPLFEKIDTDEVMARYRGIELTQRKKDDLMLGCQVVNKIRELKIDSATHSSFNEFNKDKYVSVASRVVYVRDQAVVNVAMIEEFYPNDDYQQKQLALITAEMNGALKIRAGNCHEYAMIAMFILIEGYKKNCAEMYKIFNNNHLFTMIGRTDGEEGVVVDAHQGDVYLERDIPKYLMDSDFVPMDTRHANGRHWRVMTSYNERYHSVKSIFSMKHNELYAERPKGPSISPPN